MLRDLADSMVHKTVSATARILGRVTAGQGVAEELTVSEGLEFNATGIRRSALSGVITAAAGSNTTSLTPQALPLANNDLSGVRNVLYHAEVDDGNSGVADTVSWIAGGAHKSTLTGNVVFTFTAPGGITAVTLKLVQDATGGRTVTWPASVKNAPTLTTTANTTSIISFYWDGLNYWAALLCTGVA
jgi:hypothetical protein